MNLLKHQIDVGLFTNDVDAQMDFWRRGVGLKADHVARLGGGVHQHRLAMNGSILKVNHSREPLTEVASSGISALRIAQDGRDAVKSMLDPDGNRVMLVPRGHEGVTGIAVEILARDRDAHDHFWRHVMQCASPMPGVYQCGQSLVLVREEGSLVRANTWRGMGFRYITIQVANCEAEHRGVIDRGGDEGEPPHDMGHVAKISFVRDPDGNFVELSQRASLRRS